ncbi:hypothetical protein Tco_0484271 [Tanacetum coccineum]
MGLLSTSVPLKERNTCYKAAFESVASTVVVRSAISCRMTSKVMVGVSDVDKLWVYVYEDGDMIPYDGDNDGKTERDKLEIIRLDNVVEEENGEWICFLGGNSSPGTKKYRGLNSNDGGNTGDGVKIVKDENTGGIILSLEFSEELKDLLPAEAGK